MFRPVAERIRRLNAVYCDEPEFVGVKARLLAALDLLLLVAMSINALRLVLTQPSFVEVRVGLNVLMGTICVLSLRAIGRGQLQAAGNGLVLGLVVPTHSFMALGESFLDPLSVAIQLFAFDLVVLLLALLFASRRVAILVLVLMVAGHVGLHGLALRHDVIPGTVRFAAETLLRDGLSALGFVFCLGLAVVHLIETAHLRSEEALRQTRSMNENLEALVADRTRDLETASRRATEASRAKSEFLANMSHEIRTPLNGIIASADLLRQRGDLMATAGEQVRLIAESGDLLLRLLSDILDFSKIEAGQMELERHSFQLSATVADTVAMIAPKAAAGDVHVACTLAPELPPHVLGDSYRLRQVLLNLLANAVKFTSPGGRVELRVKRGDARVAAAQVRFEVEDTGVGIEPAVLARIFDRFTQADSSTTRRYGGSGLGLAISSRLVQLMQGRLEVVSAPGRGSTFSFAIPLPPSSQSPLVTATEGEPLARLNLCVRVAEDNAVNQKIIAAQLTRLGCTCTVAADGDALLAGLAIEPLPDVILMDCHMPNLDGWEATRRIRGWADDPSALRRRAAGLPIIALTAAALPEERERCVAAGMDDFVSKPLKLAELQRVLLARAGPVTRP